MTSSKNARHIIKRIGDNMRAMDKKHTEKFLKLIDGAGSIFIFGAGRSGLAGKAFAMRLVHLGKRVHFVGEVTTPAIAENDLLIAVSGSGSTPSVVSVAQAAKKKGAKIAAITNKSASPLGEVADLAAVIPERQRDPLLGVKKNGFGGDYLERQLSVVKIMPMGTLFELTVMIYFDSIIPILMERLHVSEEHMKNKHTNLE